MPNIVKLLDTPIFISDKFNEEGFIKFYGNIFQTSVEVADLFNQWEQELFGISITLDKDPTLNLSNFYVKLEEVQAHKATIIDIFSQALSQKAIWEANLYVADRYLKQVRGELSKHSDVVSKKNKELQEAIMYSMKPDVFDCYSFCESTIGWIKTMILVFDKKLELIESANLNINRQINVTEMLSYKGLI